MHQEKIASDLARLVGVPVPEIRLGQLDGSNSVHAVSVAFGSESVDLRKVREAGGIRPGLQAALARASGPLAFHTWCATGDLKEDHVLVATDGAGQQSVAAIDFASAFGWGPDGGTVDGPTTEPKGLIENVDKAAVQAAVERIEALSDEQIRQTLAAVPENVLPIPERDRIANGQIRRRGSIRAAMQARGWLP